MTEFDESNRGGCPGSAPHAALAAAKVAYRPTLGAQRALPAARAQAATWPAVRCCCGAAGLASPPPLSGPSLGWCPFGEPHRGGSHARLGAWSGTARVRGAG